MQEYDDQEALFEGVKVESQQKLGSFVEGDNIDKHFDDFE